MIRVLQDPALDGPTQMARDEALMIHVGKGLSPPTLRLYEWDPPTVSLGYFQPFADYESLEAPARGLPVVRRLTGGGAILHDLELTYSLALPTDHRLVSRRPNDLYVLMHDALVDCLETTGVAAEACGWTDDSGPKHGPFFCFARRHKFDLLVGDGKIVGSAQRRTKDVVLQHGSIILGNRYTQQPTASPTLSPPEAIKAVRQALIELLPKYVDDECVAGEWMDTELDTAEELKDKYAGDEWVRRV